MRWLLRPSHLAILTLGLVLLYTLVGFFLVLYLIKAYAIPTVAEKLKRPVLVKEVGLNPFTLSLRVKGLEIREANQSALIGFDEFFVNFQASSLIRRAYVFDTIRLTVPYVSARVFKDGRMNLAKLVPPDGGSHPAAPLQADVALVSRTLRSNRFSSTSRNFRVSMCSPAPLIWMGRCITDAWTISRGWQAC